MITPLQSAAGTSATGSTGSASNTNEAQDRFLKLLVTQMSDFSQHYFGFGSRAR